MENGLRGPAPGAVRIEGMGTGGKHLLIVGGVHGNEPCGAHAVERLAFSFACGDLRLEDGCTLTLVRVNDVALARNRRFLRHDANRLMLDDYGDREIDCGSYEYQRAQQVKPLIRQADVVLDLHSCSSPTDPYVLTEPCNLDDFRGIGVGKIVTNWGGATCGVGDGTVEGYARLHGKSAGTVECGWNSDPAANGVAWATAIAMLHKHGLIRGPAFDYYEPIADEVYRIERAYIKKSRDFFWKLKSVRGFHPLADGEEYATEEGDSILGNAGEYLLMPAAEPRHIATGKELFLIGRRTE